MKRLNIEIKVRCSDQNKIRTILSLNNIYFKGVDNKEKDLLSDSYRDLLLAKY